MKILGIPFCSQQGKVEANVNSVLSIIREEIKNQHADLVMLPELFTSGACGNGIKKYAEALDGPTMQKFMTYSKELDVLIGFGFAEDSGQEKVYNSWALVEPDQRVHVYRKTHLHPDRKGSSGNEKEFFLPGEELAPFNTCIGNLGVMICYDGCFVEVPRTLVLKGAEIILWPTRSGRYLASRSLSQVRGLDNVVPVVQVEGGQTGTRQLEAWSIVSSEMGEALLSQDKDTTPFRVEIDLEKSNKFRQSALGAHSLYKPRRPELYEAITEYGYRKYKSI